MSHLTCTSKKEKKKHSLNHTAFHISHVGMGYCDKYGTHTALITTHLCEKEKINTFFHIDIHSVTQLLIPYSRGSVRIPIMICDVQLYFISK